MIAITAILLAIAVPNYLSARERARDSKRKQEMAQLKGALRMYYNDYAKYPQSGGMSQTCSLNGVTYRNSIMGCGVDGLQCCPNAVNTCVGLEFSAGAGGCANIYMKKFPSDFGDTMHYFLNADTDQFCLKVTLENRADGDLAASRIRCASACTIGQASMLSDSDYALCAD